MRQCVSFSGITSTLTFGRFDRNRNELSLSAPFSPAALGQRHVRPRVGEHDTDIEPFAYFAVDRSRNESRWELDRKYVCNHNMFRGSPKYQKDIKISPEALLSHLPQKLRWDLQSRHKVS
jgi:hypothetical protein